MQYFIGIVPTQEYIGKVTDFRDRWKNNSISDVVEPHITLKAQGGLTPDKKWLRKVKQVCFKTEPFDIKLEKTMFFGEDILYLSASSKQLSALHNNIVRAVEPSNELIEKYFELDDFTPHMTLGKTAYGLSKQELEEMARIAEKEIYPYPTITVNFVRVYQEIEPNKYVKFEDIPLGLKG